MSFGIEKMTKEKNKKAAIKRLTAFFNLSSPFGNDRDVTSTLF